MADDVVVLANPLLGKARQCKGRGCQNTCHGMRQLCDACYARRLLCKDCGDPHGGQPGTTTLCKLCRRGKPGKPRSERNPAWTEAEDALIRDAYARYNAHEVGPKLRELFPTRPPWSIKRRSQQIGCATVRRKEPAWSEEEKALLAECAWMVPERIAVKFRARGFQRTVTAISIRRNRLHLKDTIDGLSATGLAKMLDVDIHAVARWIEEGKLQAEVAGEREDGQRRRHIPTAAIRRFLVEHPELYELGKIERVGSKMWFLEHITAGRISEDGATSPAPTSPSGSLPPPPERTVALAGERVTLTALADICGRPVADLLHRIDGLGMSVEEAAFGARKAEDAPATPATGLHLSELPEPSLMSLAVARQVRALMRKHRASVRDVVAWTGRSVEQVERLLDGRIHLVAPALLAVVLKLGGSLRVEVSD